VHHGERFTLVQDEAQELSVPRLPRRPAPPQPPTREPPCRHEET
jgi:hypothetical protein